MTEVGCGAAYIVDVALEILILDHQLRFLQNGFVASGLNDPPLMEGKGAEGAGTKTAPVADQTEFDFLNGGNASGLSVAGMPGAAVGECVYRIHLLLRQRLLRRVLYHKFLPVGLDQPFGGERIAVAILGSEAFGIKPLVVLDFFISGQSDGGNAVIGGSSFENSAVNVGDVFDIHAGIQGISQLHDGLFTHTVHQNIGLTIE